MLINQSAPLTSSTQFLHIKLVPSLPSCLLINRTLVEHLTHDPYGSGAEPLLTLWSESIRPWSSMLLRRAAASIRWRFFQGQIFIYVAWLCITNLCWCHEPIGLDSVWLYKRVLERKHRCLWLNRSETSCSCAANTNVPASTLRRCYAPYIEAGTPSIKC